MKSASLVFGLMVSLVSVSCLAQSQDATKPAQPSAPATPNAPAETKKPKKVWTNDEIGSIKGPISVVGDAKTPSRDAAVPDEKKKADPTASAGSSAADDARQRQIENYRNQIDQIHAKMDAIDERIAQLKSFKAENTAPSGGIHPNQGYNMVPLDDQVKELEEKKKQLESKIGDIEVEARKSGIDPGDLR
jgi:hypothetical protein